MIQDPSMPAKYKYFYIGQWQFIATFIGIIIRVMIGFEFTLIEAGIYLCDAVLLFYIVAWLPMKKREKANRESMGIDFFEGPICSNKSKKEDFFLGFKRYVEINIDWDDDEALLHLFSSKTYGKYLQELIKEDVVRDFRKKSNPSRSNKNLIDSLQKDLKIREKEAGKSPTMDEKKQIEQKKRELEKARQAMSPFKMFDLSKITKEDKDKLKKLHWYYVELYETERFKDDNKGFDKLLLATNDEFSRVLRTEPSEGWYQGWNIDLRSLNVFWLLWWWLSDTMPVLYLKFSENMVEEEIDTIANMRAIAMSYAQLKVMEKWIYHLSTLPEKLVRENQRLEQKAASFEASYAYVIQDLMNDNLIYSKLIKDEVTENLKENLMKQKKKTQLASILLILVLIVVVIIFSFVFLSMTPSNPPEIPTT